jgi:NAD(P)-dependent dehydrogenase (short-subunit alcohol dehydrogenase family)
MELLTTATSRSLRRAMLSLAPVRRMRAAILRDLALPEGVLALAGRVQRAPRPLLPGLAGQRTLRAQVENKVVVITGGSSGIGLATAQRVAAAGAITIICGRDPERLASARHFIEARGHTVFTHVVNVADLAQCDAFVEGLLREHGGVDLLINNAGRSIRRAIRDSGDRFHDFERTMQLNYFGALRLTMGLLPSLVPRRGHVINISTISVLTNSARFSAYVASKAALDAWTACAATEYAGSGLSFTTINMPLVKTPMIAPTKVFENVPTLTAENAAELVVEGIITRAVRIATPVGVLSQALHAMLPEAARAFTSSLFERFPDAAIAPRS